MCVCIYIYIYINRWFFLQSVVKCASLPKRFGFVFIKSYFEKRYYIQTWHDGTLMHGIFVLYPQAPFNELDLDARSQWVGKGKTQR